MPAADFKDNLKKYNASSAISINEVKPKKLPYELIKEREKILEEKNAKY